MGWIFEQLWGLWLIFWLLALVIAFAAPFESLGWWSGWNRRDRGLPDELPRPQPGAGPFVVYLTGVAGFSGDFLSRRERGFLERLQERLPKAVIVDDVFPYSATNNPLDGDRLLRLLWVFLQRWRLKIPNNVFDLLIVMRNVGQTLVSADRRYGPVYNLGVARAIANSLLRRGYTPHSQQPIYLVAYSGGAQIGVGAAPFLKKRLGARVVVLSLGGVYTDDPSIRAVDRVIDLRGSRDHLVPPLGSIFFPGRWPVVWFSLWNQACRQGRIEWRDSGPMTHIGAGDYFGRKATMPDGTCFGDHTANLVAEIIDPSRPNE